MPLEVHILEREFDPEKLHEALLEQFGPYCRVQVGKSYSHSHDAFLLDIYAQECEEEEGEEPCGPHELGEAYRKMNIALKKRLH